MMADTEEAVRYNQVLHSTLDLPFTPGEELHLLTQDFHGQRVMNLRIWRAAPSKSGHVGYTKRGFYLTEGEALALRDRLNRLLDEPNLFNTVDTEMKEVDDTLKESEG